MLSAIRWTMSQSMRRDADGFTPGAPYRFFFFSSDKHEPPHVHVERETKRAKFWSDPVDFESNSGFGAREAARKSAGGKSPRRVVKGLA
jgi:Domain of unknown function (DUF4160)